MTHMYEILRWINIALYGGVLSGLIMHWRYLMNSLHVPGGRWWLWGLIAVGMYGTAEVVFMGQPGGPRVIFMTIMLAGFAQSLYVKPLLRILRNVRHRSRDYRAPQATDVS